MHCGNCTREIHGDRLTCLYCGWSKTEGLSSPTAAMPLPGSELPQTFRAGATTWRFLTWAIAATAAGVAILEQRPEAGSSPSSDPWTALALALFVVGPLAFVAQLFRVALVNVTVDPREGLRTSGGRRVAWEEIQAIELAGTRRGLDQSLIQSLLDAIRSISDGFETVGLLTVIRIFLIAAIGMLILLVAFASGICLPVILVLSPWQARVILRLHDGRTLVWRDLTRESDFVHQIESGLRRRSAAPPAEA